MRQNSVKHALREGKPQVGTWLTLGSVAATRYMARFPFDWMTVELEHSHTTWETAAYMFGAIADAGGVPLARIPFTSLENAKRALDCGAYGLIFPMCNTVEAAEAAVSYCKYPPQGVRSVGGGFHALNFETSPAVYYKKASDEILVVVQAEHIDAVENADQILSTHGIDAVFVGPNDLLSSMHKTPVMETDDPQFVEALDHILKTAKKYGVAPGIHVGDAAMAQRRIEQGWQFIAIGSELAFMSATAKSTSEAIFGEGSTNRGVARY